MNLVHCVLFLLLCLTIAATSPASMVAKVEWDTANVSEYLLIHTKLGLPTFYETIVIPSVYFP